MTGPASSQTRNQVLKAFAGRVEKRLQQYLSLHADRVDQRDHLRQIADRTRWLYYSELNRSTRGVSVIISQSDDFLIEACVLSHDLGLWIPLPDLQALVPDPAGDLGPDFLRLGLSPAQQDLFRQALRQHADSQAGAEKRQVDSSHHLLSAFLLTSDPALGLNQLDPADQERLLKMILGQPFGGVFKESLLDSSLEPAASEPPAEAAAGPDMLALCFHDADISDLLFVGSLEQRPNREEFLHTGGLVKVLMHYFSARVRSLPQAPPDLEACLSACQHCLENVRRRLITHIAVQHSDRWNKDAERFLAMFTDKSLADRIKPWLEDDSRPAEERLKNIRMLINMQARSFLMSVAQGA